MSRRIIHFFVLIINKRLNFGVFCRHQNYLSIVENKKTDQNLTLLKEIRTMTRHQPTSCGILSLLSHQNTFLFHTHSVPEVN